MRKYLVLLASAMILLPWLHVRAENSPEGNTRPRLVMIIRHGEKPDDASDPDLSARGRQRAEGLARRFVDQFPRPDFIFATKASKRSNRPYETVEPLGEALHVKINSKYKDADAAEVAHQLLTDPRYAGKTILICWHHAEIPALAHALNASAAPDKWNSGVFDRVWEIQYVDGRTHFVNLPEQILDGDSSR